MGTAFVVHPFDNIELLHEQLSCPLTHVQTPQWGNGIAFSPSRHLLQAPSNWKSGGDDEDTGSVVPFPPAIHNTNTAALGGYPFIPPLMYPVPVYVPWPSTAVSQTSHQPHIHNSVALHNTGYAHSTGKTSSHFKFQHQHQPHSFAMPPLSTHFMTSWGSRYSLSDLLKHKPGTYPFIDWIITQDLSFAHELVYRERSHSYRSQSIQFDVHATIPSVNGLVIHAKDSNSPLGQAIRRWGGIQVQRFDHVINVGDVLNAIWYYFQTPLTQEDQESMASGPMGFANRMEESYWRRCGGWDRHRRCDVLLHSVRFAGMEINYDFDTRSVLYLSLGDVY